MTLIVYDIPSKCRFDLIQLTLKYIRDGKDAKHLAEIIGEHRRHGHFLIQNALILGFVKRIDPEWKLTALGYEFLETEEKRKGMILVHAILDSNVMKIILQHSGSIENATQMSTKDISDLLRKNVKVSKTKDDRIRKITAYRRASSVKGWIQWLDKSLPKISDEIDESLDSAEQETLDLLE